MEITEVEIFPFDTKDMGGNIVAIADVSFDNSIKIKSFKIIESKSGGLFVTYPSLRGKDGSFYDLIIVQDKDLQKAIRDRIVQEYKKF
jgi:stage V sporulation protein G